MTLVRLLERLGHDTAEAADGREALDLLAGGTAVDLVLLDLVMPEVDGFETLATMKADPGPPPHPGHRRLRARRPRRDRPLHRDGRRGLPAAADQAHAARGARRRDARGQAAARRQRAPARRRSSASGPSWRGSSRRASRSSCPRPEGEALLAGHRGRAHGRVRRPSRVHGLLRGGGPRGDRARAARVPRGRRPARDRVRGDARALRGRRRPRVLQRPGPAGRPPAARRPDDGRAARGRRGAPGGLGASAA